ncbi:MAG: hypothetical protein CMM76_08745 [Rhodospirillaceae bacterium]|nr:hypothetical protein [Rhodospirillaceae bacterium]
MKKFLFAFGALMLLLVAAVLIAPQFINWNLYKSEITTAVRNVTGRELNIDGDIEMTVFPSLALKVSKVRLANIAGAKSKEMLQLEDVRVGVSLGALISGKLAVILTLIKPVVELEITRDGQTNWDFAQTNRLPQSNAINSEGNKEKLPVESPPFDIQLDSFRVVEGTVTYRDERTGQGRPWIFSSIKQIKNLNSEVSFDSLKGPFRLKGDARFKGLPLRFEIGTGMIDPARTAAIKAKIGLKQGSGDFTLTGNIFNLTSSPVFKGGFKGASENIATFVTRISGQEAPKISRQKMDTAAKIAISQQAISLSEWVLQFGTVRATGAADIALAGEPIGQVQLRVASFDLDGLLQENPTASSGSVETDNAEVRAIYKAGRMITEKASGRPLSFPADLDVSVNLDADVMKYRGGILRQANAKVRLAQGKIFIEQMSVLLPGSSSMGLAGTLQLSKGKPFANIRIKAQSDDLRGLLKWLKVEPSGISTSRLRRFSVDTVLQGTSENLRAQSMSAKLDNTIVQGGLTLVLGGKPAFGLSLAFDRINLDAYLPRGGILKTRQNIKSKTGNKAKGANEKISTTKSAPLSQKSATALLDKFNANIAITAKNMTFQKQLVRNFKANVSVVDGAIAVKEISVADFAGLGVALSSPPNNFDSRSPVTVNYRAELNESKRFFRFLGMARPVVLRKIGKISSTGILSGDFQKFNVNSSIKAAGGTVKMNGSIASFSTNPIFDLGVSLNVPETLALIKLVDKGYRPAKGKIGRTIVSFYAKGTPSNVTLSTIKGQVGPTTVNGSVSANLTSIIPNVSARLNFGHIDLARFKSTSGGRGRPGAYIRRDRGQKVGKGRSHLQKSKALEVAHGRWSRDRIDTSLLNSANAKFAVSIKSLNLDGLSLRDVSSDGSLKRSILKIDALNALVFGGLLSAIVTVDASSGVPALAADLNLNKAEVNQAVVALNRLRMNFGPFKFGGKIGGPVSIRNLSITAIGTSEAALVSSLTGKGRLEGTLNVSLTSGTKIGAAVAGIASIAGGLLDKGRSSLQPLTQVARTSNRLISYFGRAPNPLFGDFTINRGTVQSKNLQVVGQNAVALTAGTVNLPRWLLNTNSQIIENGQSDAALVTAAASGDIERPKIKVGGSWLRAQKQQRAKPDQKASKNSLKSSQQQQQQKLRRIQPQDILKGIFGR